jgi:hypothetical protein
VSWPDVPSAGKPKSARHVVVLSPSLSFANSPRSLANNFRIDSTTKLSRLKENIGAADVILSPAALAEIAERIADIPIDGDRYSADEMANANR